MVEGHAPTARTLGAKKCLAGTLVSAVLNRNRHLSLWWLQQKKDVNDVNLQFTNECFLNNIHVMQITK